jgi:transcriptional regulator with XRE-family HTH domain
MGRKFPLNVVGRQVAKIRNLKGLSQSALATACQLAGWDVSRESIAKIESGFRWVGDFEVIKLARILQVPITDLFPDPDVPFSKLPHA